ncbi:MAG TPA: hypothetical protein DDW87_05255 [Firmicutes bacterium]|nr:hypothetical protein [Bacillota bacterium]
MSSPSTQHCSWLAPHSSLQIPEPVGLGKPNRAYLVHWAIYRWINGDIYSDGNVRDHSEAARELAGLVNELQAIDIPHDAPRAGRRPLAELDKVTVQSIEEAGDLVDRKRALAAWEQSCEAAVWDANPVWRTTFRRSVSASIDTWMRARAYALHQAALIIPYYRKTNPQFVASAKRTIDQILLDMDLMEV